MAQVTFNTGRGLPVMDFEQLTVSNSVKTLTVSKYVKVITTGGSPESSKMRITAQRAVLTVSAQPICVTIDGTTPDASTGHVFVAGDTIELTDQVQIANFKAIRQGGTDAGLAVTYFGG
jgi:hypothetical protein